MISEVVSLPVNSYLCKSSGDVGVPMLDLLVVTFGDGDFWRLGCLSGDFGNSRPERGVTWCFPFQGIATNIYNIFGTVVQNTRPAALAEMQNKMPFPN